MPSRSPRWHSTCVGGGANGSRSGVRLSRRDFVLLFLAFGFALHFATKFLLDQPPGTVWASANQAGWQWVVSTAIAPLRLVLFGPINWLMQDPDPPPPFRLILCAAYWSVLALGIHEVTIGDDRRRGGSASPPT